MNVEGARLARAAADGLRGRFVAGSVGPLNVTLSLSPKVEDASFRAVSFDQVYEAYAEQIRGLREGGVDLLLVETIFDTLNAKAAIAAAKDVAPELPLWLSVTIVDRSGRTLSGQTIEAFWISVEHADPVIVGINCSLGASEMRPYVEDLARVATVPVACYPNAGPAQRVRRLRRDAARSRASCWATFARDGPREHRGRMLRHDAGAHPRRSPTRSATSRPAPCPPSADPLPHLSGLEPFRITPGDGLRDDRRAAEHHRLPEVPPPDRVGGLPRAASRSRWNRSAAAPTSST